MMSQVIVTQSCIIYKNIEDFKTMMSSHMSTAYNMYGLKDRLRLV